ncbi:hypothetical protein C0Q70_06515 [Pomacea canaliculata]|uniref:Stanniocalcin n=1 Tax=Pomacea canaliculata TaxID=400727 RepID=A0A2T7PP79_POMCA|nr:hypothetical protein C0Q70_06515 [Pomacea canaliculata]
MKVVVVVLALVLTLGCADAWWIFSRNNERTATADGRPVDSACVAHGQSGNCEFFNCFEQRLPCGREFYMQRYGNFYCNRFQTFMPSFTAAGQEFLRNTQQCMNQRLLDTYSRDYVNCHNLEHDAVAAVGDCYRRHGFCDIIGDNAQQLWREILGLARHCGGQALTRFMASVSSRVSPLRSLIGNGQ